MESQQMQSLCSIRYPENTIEPLWNKSVVLNSVTAPPSLRAYPLRWRKRKMKINFLVAFCATYLITGCTINTNTMVVQGTDGTSHYSQYYDFGNWITKEKIGLIVRAEHSKKVPITYGLQRYIGALGPNDFDASAQVTLGPANYSKQKVVLEIHSLYSKYSEQNLLNHQTIILEPRSEKIIEIEPTTISNFGTEIVLNLECSVNGERIEKEITLKRLTFEEIDRIVKQGASNYPWAGSSNQSE